MVEVMDDDKERLRALLLEIFPQLEFSNIHCFPNHGYGHEKLFDAAPEFGGSNVDSATIHIVCFFKLVADFNIYREDDLMICLDLGERCKALAMYPL